MTDKPQFIRNEDGSYRLAQDTSNPWDPEWKRHIKMVYLSDTNKPEGEYYIPKELRNLGEFQCRQQ